MLLGSQDATESEAAVPPGLTAEMITTIGEYGISVQVEKGGSPSTTEDAATAERVARKSFNFIDTSSVANVSIATVESTDDDDVPRSRMWVVYMTDVDVPEFGHMEEGENKNRDSLTWSSWSRRKRCNM